MSTRFLRLLSLFLVLIGAQISLGDEAKQVLMLELRDGSRVAYYL